MKKEVLKKTFALTEFPKISDARGNLTFIEGMRHVPFNIKVGGRRKHSCAAGLRDDVGSWEILSASLTARAVTWARYRIIKLRHFS